MTLRRSTSSTVRHVLVVAIQLALLVTVLRDFHVLGEVQGIQHGGVEAGRTTPNQRVETCPAGQGRHAERSRDVLLEPCQACLLRTVQVKVAPPPCPPVWLALAGPVGGVERQLVSSAAVERRLARGPPLS